MDTGIIGLINFSKKFFEGRCIKWIGSVGFISINDCVVRISYMNHFGPNVFLYKLIIKLQEAKIRMCLCFMNF
jgi:hypothetical protein